MNEYFEKQAAIDALMVAIDDVGILDSDDIKVVFDNLPSADVQPVRHGTWMEENRRPRSAIFYCSECHRTAYDIQPTRDKTWTKRCRYAYCPNCGARMDGDTND